MREEFILSWSENIAKAAKDGWSDQQELDWDSYDKIKQEMAVQQLQLDADMAKAKEMAKINAVKAAVAKAEKAALAKAEKMARIAEKRKEREEKAKQRREIKSKARRKSKKSGELSVPQELKLKQRLTKVKKPVRSHEFKSCSWLELCQLSMQSTVYNISKVKGTALIVIMLYSVLLLDSQKEIHNRPGCYTRRHGKYAYPSFGEVGYEPNKERKTAERSFTCRPDPSCQNQKSPVHGQGCAGRLIHCSPVQSEI